MNTYGVFADVADIINNALNDLGLPTVIRTCVDLRMVCVYVCVWVCVCKHACARVGASLLVSLRVCALF